MRGWCHVVHQRTAVKCVSCLLWGGVAAFFFPASSFLWSATTTSTTATIPQLPYTAWSEALTSPECYISSYGLRTSLSAPAAVGVSSLPLGCQCPGWPSSLPCSSSDFTPSLLMPDNHSEHRIFHITDAPQLPLHGYSWILGYPWLLKHNPHIDWVAQLILSVWTHL